MNENTKIIILLIATLIVCVGTILILSNQRDEGPPLSKQNVVCDTGYGVQYFEYKGNLTLRVNHEGRPIRCYE